MTHDSLWGYSREYLPLSFQDFWGEGGRVTRVILEVGWIKIQRFMTRDSLLAFRSATFKDCRGCLGEFLYKIEVGWFIICDSLPFVATEASLAGYAATEASPASGSWSNPKKLNHPLSALRTAALRHIYLILRGYEKVVIRNVMFSV